MASSDSIHLPGVPRTPVFATTCWTVVMKAAETESPEAAKALESLCLAYWYPIYVYVRRKGHNPDDAQDLTQEFFAQLIERKVFRHADQTRGRFRSFLLTSLQNFLAKEHRKSTTQKRGGGTTIYSLDFKDAEGRYLSIKEPSHDATPEKMFEREWAKALLARVLDNLRSEYVESGQAGRFDALQGCLVDVQGLGSYADIAARLQTTEGAVKTAIHRMRRRFSTLYRHEITQLVESEDEVQDEIRALLEALSG